VPAPVLNLVWAERGARPIEPPQREGFGSRMIDRVVAGELGGAYEPDYASDGFSCRITVPLNT
jgi:two-component sensor histidine kinase